MLLVVDVLLLPPCIVVAIVTQQPFGRLKLPRGARIASLAQECWGLSFEQ